MLVLFTDFGIDDPYVGQMHAVLSRRAPGTTVIDLLHSVPVFDIQAAAYLLPAYISEFPEESVFCCVVDPGVGGSRKAIMARADSRWFVGPDNGLFAIVRRRAVSWRCHEIVWRPEYLSASFHGRDLFAPVAAELSQGRMPAHGPAELTMPSDRDWPDDLPRIVYIDHYGNAVTGLRADRFNESVRLELNGVAITYARMFSDARVGDVFWYENSNRLVEIAANRASAREVLNIQLGDVVGIQG
jgi:S-adenosylmethionine hydrolase